MAGVSLTDSQSCSDFFQRRILLNIRYWHENRAVKTTDVAVLDQEWSGLIRAITFAFEIDRAWPLTRELIASLSPYMERRGYWETWHRILDQAVETARRAGDLAGAVELSLLLARLLQRESRLKEAGSYYRQTIRLARRVGDENSEARACSNLGYLFVEQGHWHRAEVLCCHALTIFERIDSDHGRAHTENHLGTLYFRQHRWELARQHLERACAIWEAIHDSHGMMRGYINLSALYIGMECPEKILHYLMKANHQAKITGEESEFANINMNIGIAYRLSGEPTKAETYLWQAEAIFRKFSNLVGLAEIRDNLGLVCLDQKKWQEAKIHFDIALQAWRNLGNKLGEFRVLMYLIEYELMQGNRTGAIRRLATAEYFITQNERDGADPKWQALLEKYRLTLGKDHSGKI